MLSLNSPIEQLFRVGEATAKQLKKLGIEKISDLIFYYPFRYDDFSNLLPISKVRPNTIVTIQGRIDLIANKRTPRQRRMITEALISDDSGMIKVVWFNQPWLTKNLMPGDAIYLAGRVDFDRYGLQLVSPSYEKFTKSTTHTARIVPVYPSSGRLTPKQIRWLIKTVLPLVKEVKDWLPVEVKKNATLIDLPGALRQIHFPDDKRKLAKAIYRLKFDELFLVQLQASRLRKELEKSQAIKIEFKEQETKAFVASLPFKLTEGQRKAAWEIIKDLGRGRPMNRLLDGDVGSGKTVVTAMAILNCFLNGYQVAYMAPTEILAKQHWQTFSKLFADLDIKIGLITRSEKRLNTEYGIQNTEDEEKKFPNSEFRIPNSDLVIGTHALIQEGIEFNNLSLVIVDEQHRFGVEQRKALKKKNRGQEFLPHFLSMTATPIPRTLALAFYGDLDLSIINSLPKERKKIITRLIRPERRFGAYGFIQEEVKNGRQAFVICPLIDPSDKLGVKSATAEYKKISKEIFPNLRIGLLHGRLKAEEKAKIMAEFSKNKINVLVATSVIEVGIDVPNATIMMIEGADRFGLAQLHQFRGRVGRSSYQSYCFLFTDSDSLQTAERLKALVESDDGFKLAEKDLELRGSGELYGLRQSGMPEFKMASLADLAIIKKAKEQAEIIIGKIDNYPMLVEKLNKFKDTVHLE